MAPAEKRSAKYEPGWWMESSCDTIRVIDLDTTEPQRAASEIGCEPGDWPMDEWSGTLNGDAEGFTDEGGQLERGQSMRTMLERCLLLCQSLCLCISPCIRICICNLWILAGFTTGRRPPGTCGVVEQASGGWTANRCVAAAIALPTCVLLLLLMRPLCWQDPTEAPGARGIRWPNSCTTRRTD